MALETELAGETEQNKDDIEHLEALEKHFEEKVKGYEVCNSFLTFVF